jgi:hypothetical protein
MQSPPYKTSKSFQYEHCQQREDLTYVHVVEAFVDTVESLGVGDKLVDLEGTLHVVYNADSSIAGFKRMHSQRKLTLNNTGQLGSALNPTERGTLPYSTSHKLESEAQEKRVSPEQDGTK